MKPDLDKNEDDIKEEFFNLKRNKDIANLLEVGLSTLIYYAYRMPKEIQYREYKIPKRNGKNRTISAPISNLKILQKKLNSIFQLNYESRRCAYAFIKDKNVIMNAKEHKKSKVILKIDLKDFFKQIHFGRVRGMFMSKHPFNFNENVATTLANICTYKAKLPQGAPTSPIISNMICWSLDKDLQYLTRDLRCKYTRYADDITISTKESELPKEIMTQKGSQIVLGKTIVTIFNKHRFKINHDKTTLYKNNKRQLVTGLVVNDFVNVKREYVRQTRKELFIWEKYGLEELAKKKYKPSYKNPYKQPNNVKWSIQGKLNFLKQVKGESNRTYRTLHRWASYLVIRDHFDILKQSMSYQARGYALEDLFNDLFSVNQIDVKKSFHRNHGVDRIDGAFLSSKGIHFIVECKWSDPKRINKNIKSFLTDVRNSGEGTKGLFISIKGWNENALRLLKLDKTKSTILMNGEDLDLIIKNRKIDPDELIEWKLKALMFENKPHVNSEDFLSTISFN